MKKIILLLSTFLLLSCGSRKSFQSFFNQHKNEIGVTAFQVPNFMKALLRNMSPEINGVFKNVSDFKFITFKNISAEKKHGLIEEINLVTAKKFTDIFRKNTSEKTKIVSVKEDGNIVTKAIIFNSTLKKTTVFYLKGRFNPDRIKKLSTGNQFEKLSTNLMQNYQTPSFNINK